MRLSTHFDSFYRRKPLPLIYFLFNEKYAKIENDVGLKNKKKKKKQQAQNEHMFTYYIVILYID